MFIGNLFFIVLLNISDKVLVMGDICTTTTPFLRNTGRLALATMIPERTLYSLGSNSARNTQSRRLGPAP